MGITIHGHQHDPAATLEGADGQQLIVQKGTIIFTFPDPPNGEGWVRKRLVYEVLDLSTNSLLLTSDISAIACAAPCSMDYSPPNFVRFVNRDRHAVDLSVDEPLAAGWAVDRTQATRSFKKINLQADLAILGSCREMRLGYSLFVTLKPRLAIRLDHPIQGAGG